MTTAAPWNTTIPDMLNGYPVVAYIEHDACATIIVDRSKDTGFTDYAVATWWPELGSTWAWGHYDLATYDDATKTMREVAQRNARRS